MTNNTNDKWHKWHVHLLGRNVTNTPVSSAAPQPIKHDCSWAGPFLDWFGTFWPWFGCLRLFFLSALAKCVLLLRRKQEVCGGNSHYSAATITLQLNSKQTLLERFDRAPLNKQASKQRSKQRSKQTNKQKKVTWSFLLHAFSLWISKEF